MAIMNKMLLVVALLMAVVVSAMGLLADPIDPFPFPLPDGCIGLKCRKGT